MPTDKGQTLEHSSMQNMSSPVSRIQERKMVDGKCRRFNYVICESPLKTIKDTKSESEKVFFTPPGRHCQVKNPFEIEIDSLHASSYSPSIFAISKKNSEERSFRWSIEQLSSLQPADIDESSTHGMVCFHLDSEEEERAQEAITEFFSKSIAPSPWTPVVKEPMFVPYKIKGKCKKATSGEECCSQNNASTQTMLSIPPSVDLTSLLGRFFTQDIQSESFNSSLSELDVLSTSRRRKLFKDDDDDPNSDSPPLHTTLGIDIDSKSSPDLKTFQWSTSPVNPRFESRKFSFLEGSSNISLIAPPISPISVKIQECGSKENLEDLESQSILMTSICEPNTLPQSEMNTFSYQYDTNDGSSLKKDTGYWTGSINSTASCLQTASYSQLRATPVAELLGDCVINKEQVSDMSFDMEASMMRTSSDFCSESKGYIPVSFNNMTWKPDKFSTPSKKPMDIE